MSKIERHTWLNAIVGILDGAFALSDEELYFTTVIVRRILEKLRIPERGEALVVPLCVAQEAASGQFSVNVHAGRSAGFERPSRGVLPSDTVVTLEAWRQALMSMLQVPYRDLSPLELLWATKAFDDLLLALGVPDRAAHWLPDEVVRAHGAGA